MLTGQGHGDFVARRARVQGDATVLNIAEQTQTDEMTADLLEDDDELLIEEISIDGMCGVY